MDYCLRFEPGKGAAGQIGPLSKRKERGKAEDEEEDYSKIHV